MTRRIKGEGKPHLGLKRGLAETKEWKELSPQARCYYLRVKGRYWGKNNGEIRLPYSDMRKEKGFSSNETISNAIKELKKKKWIRITRRGGLIRHDNLFTLTFKYDTYAAEKPSSKYRDKNKL